ISATVTAYALRASCQLRLQQAERGQGAEQAAEQSQAQAQQQMQSQEQSQAQPEEQRINIERYEQSLHHYIERYSSDYMLQYELMSSLLDCYKLLNRRDEVLEQRCSSLARLMEHCYSYEGSINHSSQAEMQQSAATVNHDNGWKLYLFGGLRFARGQQERRQLSWKRRKARELLLYLALQPHYTAVREQIIDKLQLGEPLDKANQQLYVIVHQLKRTLLTELGIEQGIIVQDGLIRLHEDTIEYVDVEHYLALTRV